MTFTAASVIGAEAAWATATLAGMCLVMWFLARLAKRRMGIGAGTVSAGALRVVGKRPLDQRSALWVVEVGDRYLLLGSGTDGTVTKLDDISAAEYATMTDEPAARPTRIGLARLARPAARRDGEDVDPADEQPAEDPRFATVGESFQALLAKARDTRANRRASGDD